MAVARTGIITVGADNVIEDVDRALFDRNGRDARAGCRIEERNHARRGLRHRPVAVQEVAHRPGVLVLNGSYAATTRTIVGGSGRSVRRSAKA
ncbi:MAG: hypothetical protein U0470_01995 [Anaerolineae bacterium]